MKGRSINIIGNNNGSNNNRQAEIAAVRERQQQRLELMAKAKNNKNDSNIRERTNVTSSGIPNKGLGLGFAWTSSAFITGLQWTVPLFAVAGVMRILEPHSQALQEVTKATQRSVLAVMGKKRRPVFALFVSILLGAVAGTSQRVMYLMLHIYYVP